MAAALPPTGLPSMAMDGAYPSMSSIPPTTLPVEVAMPSSTGTTPPLAAAALANAPFGEQAQARAIAQPQTQAYAQPQAQGYAQPQGQGYAQPQAQGYAQPQGQAYAQPQGQAYAHPQPQAQAQTLTQMGAAGVGGTNSSSIQSNVNKVKEQLHKHGGKTGATLATALQGQADALAKVNIVGDINSNGRPVEFHVHKAGGIFSKDDVVLDVNNQPLFYLSFPHTPLHSSWSLSLHHVSRDGPLLGTLIKSSYGLQKDDVTINLSLPPSGAPFKTVLTRPSLISKAHDFTGVGGARFKWKGDGPLSQAMKCIDLTNGHVAATWEKSYSYGKDGKMLISPAYISNELHIIMATGLAMEEWRREEEEKGGKGGPMSTKNMLGMGMKFLKK